MALLNPIPCTLQPQAQRLPAAAAVAGCRQACCPQLLSHCSKGCCCYAQQLLVAVASSPPPRPATGKHLPGKHVPALGSDLPTVTFAHPPSKAFAAAAAQQYPMDCQAVLFGSVSWQHPRVGRWPTSTSAGETLDTALLHLPGMLAWQSMMGRGFDAKADVDVPAAVKPSTLHAWYPCYINRMSHAVKLHACGTDGICLQQW